MNTLESTIDSIASSKTMQDIIHIANNAPIDIDSSQPVMIMQLVDAIEHSFA